MNDTIATLERMRTNSEGLLRRTGSLTYSEETESLDAAIESLERTARRQRFLEENVYPLILPLAFAAVTVLRVFWG